MAIIDLEKKEKRKKQILSLIIVVLSVFILGISYSFFTGGKPRIPIKKISLAELLRLKEKDASIINISSNPSGAEVFLDGVSTKLKTPAEIKDVRPGGHALLLVLGGHYSEQITLNLQKSETKSMNVDLKTSPRLVKSYKGRLVLNPMPFGDTALIYFNPRNRLIEVNKNEKVHVLFKEKITDVNELWWDETAKKAIIVTGGLEQNKKDYLVNFENWDEVSDPDFAVLPLAGTTYAWSKDSSKALFIGDINYTTGSANLIVYDFKTSEALRLKNASIVGVSSLFWSIDGSIYGTEELEPVNEDEFRNLFKFEETLSGWTKTAIAKDIASIPEMSGDHKKIIFIEGETFALLDLTAGEKRNIHEVSKFGPNFAYTFGASSNSLFVAYPDGEGNLVLTETDLENGNFRFATIRVKVTGELDYARAAPSGDLIISSSSGDTVLLNISR